MANNYHVYYMVMMGIRQRLTGKIIYSTRRVFYNTPVMRWRVTGYVYDKVFSFGMPDLSKPIEFRNVKLYIDPRDRSYAPTMVGGYYEKHELDVFDDLSKLSTTMFDVGANIGMYSIIAATNNQKIRCYAFEPVSENQELLRRNIQLNSVSSRVKLVKYAASDSTGTATIHLSETMSGTHSLSVDHGGEKRQIDTITIDEYCTRHALKPNLIKIDVEGHEVNVLRGMAKTLKHHPTIFMEHIPHIHSEMEKIMKNLASEYDTLYYVDELSGRVRKSTLKNLPKNKMSNIILASNKSHINAIKSHLFESKTV